MLTVAAPSSSLPRGLYTIACLGSGSGVVFAWTFLRAVNGALCIRVTKLAGPGPRPNAPPLKLAVKEARSRNLERNTPTRELVTDWMNLNEIRAWVLIVGAFVGIFAVVMSASL